MIAKNNNSGKILSIFRILNDYFGDLGWWPAETPFEVMVGAVLTQNTSWKNVEKAIRSLKQKKLMSPKKILLERNLPEIIRSAGFNNLKAKRLKNLCGYLLNKGGSDFVSLRGEKTDLLRNELLEINGIGPETADCILLYALGKPVFVVDNYTRRILVRHCLTGSDDPYSRVQDEISRNFPKNVLKLKQFHAVLVETAKKFCGKTQLLCDICPLCKLLPQGRDQNG